MSEDTIYYGWSSLETWSFFSWMDNDEGSQGLFRSMAQEAYDKAERTEDATREQVATYQLAKAIQEIHEENEPETTGVYAALLSAALREVNWQEIAGYLIDAVVKDGDCAQCGGFFLEIDLQSFTSATS